MTSVYVAYYFRDYRKENNAEIYGVFKNRQDAIDKLYYEIRKVRKCQNYTEDGLRYIEDLFEDTDKQYFLSFNDGQENYLVEKKDLE